MVNLFDFSDGNFVTVIIKLIAIALLALIGLKSSWFFSLEDRQPHMQAFDNWLAQYDAGDGLYTAITWAFLIVRLIVYIIAVIAFASLFVAIADM